MTTIVHSETPARLERVSRPMRFLAFLYRNAKAYKPNASHVGLGVSAQQHVTVLRRYGIKCDAYACYEIDDTIATLKKLPSDSVVIIEAFWLITANVQKLLVQFPEMEFVVRCHSQIAFLQVEPQAIELMREQIVLQELNPRFIVAGNNMRFTQFVMHAYHTSCLYLPNLYDAVRTVGRATNHPHDRLLRVGAFGALRNLKMHISGLAGAMLAAQMMGKDLEFDITVGRDEGGVGLLASMINMTKGLTWLKLVQNPWTSWPDFRRIVAHMDLCVQTSATETFNIVTADALSEGVPCIVSPAINWAPVAWQAEIDSPEVIASKMVAAFHDPQASQTATSTIRNYINSALSVWLAWLTKTS